MVSGIDKISNDLGWLIDDFLYDRLESKELKLSTETLVLLKKLISKVIERNEYSKYYNSFLNYENILVEHFAIEIESTFYATYPFNRFNYYMNSNSLCYLVSCFIDDRVDDVNDNIVYIQENIRNNKIDNLLI